MYLTIKTAKRKTKDHYGIRDDPSGKTPYLNGEIYRGEKFLQLNNGTIGAGARAVNIGKASAVKLLQELLNELTRGVDDELSSDELSNVL